MIEEKKRLGRCITGITSRDELNTENNDVAMYSSDDRERRIGGQVSYSALVRKLLLYP